MLGDANDAVSADTPVKMKDASRLQNLPAKECDTHGMDTGARHPANWDKVNDPVVFLESNFHGQPLARIPSKRKLEKVLLQDNKETEKFANVQNVHRNANLFLSAYVDDIMVGHTEKQSSHVSKAAKKVDLECLTPLTNQVNLGYTRRASTIDEESMTAKTDLFLRITTTCVDETQKKGKPLTTLQKFRSGVTI